MPTYQTVQVLPTFPDFAQFEYELPIQGTTWVFRFTWRERLQSWYLSIYYPEGGALAINRRLSPNTKLTESRLDFPGNLVCVGDDSHRDNLGATLNVIYYELA